MPAPETDLIETTLRLTQALNLARRGRLREAEAAITGGGGVPQDAVALHALAALATAGGDFRRALQLWRLLLQRDPAHRDARRMIAAIELWLARPLWMQFVPWIAGTVFVALLGGVLLWAF